MKYPHLTAYLAGTLVHFESKEIISAMVLASEWVMGYSNHCRDCNKPLEYANIELVDIYKSVEGAFEAGKEVNSITDVPVMAAVAYRLFYPEPSAN